ncbi:hypothetical protein K788_0003941 [Paraburkholderia caribensis MBA4]|uniref:Uncharacterized protein n=1 Tax=Paraburkholderia caribensis MBA4 TaxID=1323664 RepID=A0A0P0RAI4_9BURK|nr:hypothetical protein K788_0003941 [Paraburkholderia caribensis MBA4]
MKIFFGGKVHDARATRRECSRNHNIGLIRRASKDFFRHAGVDTRKRGPAPQLMASFCVSRLA